MDRRRGPTHFVSIQITDPDIKRGVHEVQDYMCLADENLSEAMFPVPKLHLTLKLARLDNEDISRMIKAIDQCAEIFNKDNKKPIILDVSDIGNFENVVIFAKMEEDECLSRVIKLSKILEERCQKNGIAPFDTKGFNPHITIAKRSQLPQDLKELVKTIEPSTYSSYKHKQFGKQLVTCVQLCSMRKNYRTNYYQVLHLAPIAS